MQYISAQYSAVHDINTVQYKISALQVQHNTIVQYSAVQLAQYSIVHGINTVQYKISALQVQHSTMIQYSAVQFSTSTIQCIVLTQYSIK